MKYFSGSLSSPQYTFNIYVFRQENNTDWLSSTVITLNIKGSNRDEDVDKNAKKQLDF